MKPSFWHKIWDEGRIGFHQEHINDRLQQFFPMQSIAEGSTVFVPLAGKSRDLLWLHEKGHHVLGVELSDIAVNDFFEEAGMVPVVEKAERFERWSADGITFFVGDFFDLEREDLAEVGAYYDRASLIALPPEMRRRYARHLGHILPGATPGLLITIEYPPHEMNGPPFTVSEEEVRDLFNDDFLVERVVADDVLERTRFRERLSGLTEKVFVMSRKADG